MGSGGGRIELPAEGRPRAAATIDPGKSHPTQCHAHCIQLPTSKMPPLSQRTISGREPHPLERKVKRADAATYLMPAITAASVRGVLREEPPTYTLYSPGSNSQSPLLALNIDKYRDSIVNVTLLVSPAIR